MEQNKKNRIGWVWGTILIFLAILADVIGIVPFLEWISGTIFWVIAGFILWMRGCGLLNWKRFVTAGISLLIGLIPALQVLPQITAGIIAIIVLVVLEDKTGMSLVKPLSQGKKVQLPTKPKPLNQGGIREPTKV